MRKLFSLIAAVLFAGSMMAQVTITPDNCGWTGTAGAQSGVVEGVTVANTNGLAGVDQSTGVAAMRIYKSATLTISAETNITKIEFTCAENGTTKFGPGCFGEQEGYTFEAEGPKGTWVGSAKQVEFVASANQVRATQIVVTLDDDDDDDDPDEVVIYDWRGKIGATILGGNSNIAEATVKIHENTDEIPAIKFGSSFVYADGKWIAIKPAEGGFKAGDVLYVAAVFNNANENLDKYAQVDLRAADGDTRIWMSDSASTINGRLSAAEPIVQTYKLESDQDSLFLGRYGNTGMFIVTLMVGRPEEEPIIEPEQEYFLVGTKIGWEAKADFKLAKNPGQEGEWMIDYTAEANEGIKVLGVKGEEKTWYNDKEGQEYIITEAGDYTIYFRPEGNSDWGYYYFEPVKKEALKDPTTCAEAAEAALSVEKNNDLYNGGKEYTIQGYVTEIAYAWSASAKNMSFWMADDKEGGKVLEAYKCAIELEENAVRVGDLVKVTGKLTKYNTTPEFAAGCTVEIVERAEQPEPKNLGEKTIAEFLELKNTVDTCILTGIVANIKTNSDGSYNKYGNFDLVEIDNEEVKVYIYGLLTADGQAQKFQEMGIDAGDTLKLKAVYGEYNNAPQVKNAIFVEVKKAPVAGEKIEITISSLTTPGAIRWTDAVASQGWWQIWGQNDTYAFSLSNNYTTETAGTYTVADLDPDYSYVEVIETEAAVSFVDGSVTVAVAEDGIVTVVGELTGDDGNIYAFNLTYKDPVAEKTVEVAIPEWELADTYISYGLFAVAGEAEDGTYVQLALWMEGTTAEDIFGEYTEDDIDERYIGTGIVNPDKSQTSIYTAEIKIEEGAESGHTIVTAEILAYNNTLYKVTTIRGQGIDNVNGAVKAIKSIENGQLIIEKAGKTYNAQGAVVR